MTKHWQSHYSCRVAILLSLSLIAACASSLTEDDSLMREYVRVERMESIRAYVAACEQSGHTIVYNGPSYHKLRDPVKHIPNHATLKNYACVSVNTVDREFGTGG